MTFPQSSPARFTSSKPTRGKVEPSRMWHVEAGLGHGSIDHDQAIIYLFPASPQGGRARLQPAAPQPAFAAGQLALSCSQSFSIPGVFPRHNMILLSFLLLIFLPLLPLDKGCWWYRFYHSIVPLLSPDYNPSSTYIILIYVKIHYTDMTKALFVAHIHISLINLHLVLSNTS
jgi:hypothetical protein